MCKYVGRYIYLRPMDAGIWYRWPTCVLLGGGFKYFFIFNPTWGKISNLTNIFQGGWNHQLVLHRYHGLLQSRVPQASLLGHTTVLHADAWFKFTSTNPSKKNGSLAELQGKCGNLRTTWRSPNCRAYIPGLVSLLHVQLPCMNNAEQLSWSPETPQTSDNYR